MKGEGDWRTVSFVLATIVGSKNKNIHLRDFEDVRFNFTHFANFKFAYFEIEVSFGSNYKMADFTSKFPFWVLKRCSFQLKALFLFILCILEIMGKFG